MVAFAGVIKLPQIWSIIRANTAQGLSTLALCIETFGYVYNLAYHYREQYPFSTYGDFLLLTFQNLFILFLSYRYRHLYIQSIGKYILNCMAFVSHLILRNYCDFRCSYFFHDELMDAAIFVAVTGYVQYSHSNGFSYSPNL